VLMVEGRGGGKEEVMMGGQLGKVRLKNLLVPGVEGGFTRHLPDAEQMSIYDAAMKYKAQGVPLLVIGGKEDGAGSSRDWAAKGTTLLGGQAGPGGSLQRSHPRHLVGMGGVPPPVQPRGDA